MAKYNQEKSVYPLQGEINFHNALQLRGEVETAIVQAPSELCVDFSAVTDTKCVTLCLLTAWSRCAIKYKKNLEFAHVTPKLQQLIHLCCLEEILASHLH